MPFGQLIIRKENSMSDVTIIRIVIALARALDIDPIDLAMKYMEGDENQEFYNIFLMIAAESEE